MRLSPADVPSRSRICADEFLDLVAQLALRQADEDRVLLELVGGHFRPIALDVEGRRDDLPLLFRQRAGLVLLPPAAPAPAAAARLRLRLPEVLAERAAPR